MTSYILSPVWGAGAQLFDNSGNVLTGGKIETYAAGTTTNAVTYTDPIGNTFNSNPIIADASGRLSNEIWLPVGTSYKFVLKDANNVLIATYDNIPTIPQPLIVNDASSISYEQGYTVTAGAFTVGATYRITSVGTTNFVAIGAAANVTGILFTATGAGSGDGTAEYSRTVQTKLRETVSVKDFGAVGNGIANDTAAIVAGLNYLKPTGGTLFFPNGVYLTDSIDLRNFQSITLTGTEGGAQPWLQTCQIKIRTACAVGIQMADVNTNNSTNSGTAITIQNFYLNCNNLATTGMNMNYNIFINNVAVRYALGDGIVFEGFTYPIYLNNVNVQYCGGNGLKVKGPLTTIYSVYNSGFSGNDGYGVYIEGGAFAIFNNVTSQSNKQGGLKLYNNDPAIYTGENYLQSISFYNFYTEASGSLDPSDPNYEGNYAILTGSYNQDPTTETGKIGRLLFQECQFNPTPTVGQTYSLNGLNSDTNFISNNINYNNLNASTSAIAKNVTFGYKAAWNISNPATYTIAIGFRAGDSVTGAADSIVIGKEAQRFGNGVFTGVVAVGANALYENNGNYCVGIGDVALYANTTGGNNTAIGRSAGTGVGGDAVNANTTGSNNTFVGAGAVGASATASNVITLGNASIATLRCQVTTITALSDARDKDNINPLMAGLDFVNRLKPISFDWNMRDGAKVGVADTGFIAQDLKQVQIDAGIEIPGLVYEENPEKLEAAYGKLIPVLVKAIQELKAEVDALKAK